MTPVAVELHDGHRLVRVISGSHGSSALHTSPNPSPPAAHWTTHPGTKRAGALGFQAGAAASSPTDQSVGWPVGPSGTHRTPNDRRHRWTK